MTMTCKCKDGKDDHNDDGIYGKRVMTMTMMRTWKWQTGLSSPVTVLVSLDYDDNHVLVTLNNEDNDKVGQPG